MLDLKKEIKNYPVIEIDAITKKDPSIPDSIKNSMILYNKAIDSILMDNEDMAIIKLKKAISMNPSFYEAMNLLGIIHMSLEENDKAYEIFQRIMKAESNSLKAQKYVSILNGGDPEDKKGKPKRAFKVLTINNEALKLTFIQMLGYSVKKDIIKYILGIVLGIMVGFILFNNPIPDNTEDINAFKKTIDSQRIEYDSLDEELSLMQNEKQRVENLVKEKDQEAEVYKNSEQIFEIENLIFENKTLEAAKKLELLKGAKFTEQGQIKFNILYKSVLKDAALILYEEAKILLKDANTYEKALEYLQRAAQYDSEFGNITGLIYFTGKAYMLMKDYENAKANFQRLVDDYSGYANTSYAILRLKEIGRLEEN